MMESWSLDSVIRGHHVSKAVWTPTLEDVTLESGNMYDCYAIAIHKPGIGVVGLYQENSPERFGVFCRVMVA